MTIPFTRRLAVAAALAAMVFAASASEASAGSHERILTKGGVVWFDHSGEYIAALDRRKDGHAVRALLDWWVWEDGEYIHHDAEVTDDRGYTNGPADPHLSVYRRLRIPEGTTVRLMMCYSQGPYNRQCSQPQSAKA
jgi:hypothetical protein